MSSTPNPNVANSLQTALTSGMSESTVETQHVKAIAYLTANTGTDSNDVAAITLAKAILTTQLAHIRAPGTKGGA